ncbi:MAG: FtsX-like permease family protein [Pirellulales bacterium]
MSNETIRATSQGLDFVMVLCVCVAIFMLLNSFLMNIGERRKQLAIMCAIGTTKGQIMKQMLFEGLCYGLLGAVIGVPLGILVRGA